MDATDIEKINKIISDRREANRFFLENSAVYRAFVKLEQTTFSDGALPRRHKELIAIGISIVINCESCLEWHIREALRAGASEQEVLEAIEVGIEMGGGPATVSARFPLKVLRHYTSGDAQLQP